MTTFKNGQPGTVEMYQRAGLLFPWVPRLPLDLASQNLLASQPYLDLVSPGLWVSVLPLDVASFDLLVSYEQHGPVETFAETAGLGYLHWDF